MKTTNIYDCQQLVKTVIKKYIIYCLFVLDFLSMFKAAQHDVQ